MTAGQMTDHYPDNRLFVGPYDCHQQNRLAELFFGNFQARLPEQNCRAPPTAARAFQPEHTPPKTISHPTHPQLGLSSPSPPENRPHPHRLHQLAAHPNIQPCHWNCTVFYPASSSRVDNRKPTW